MSDSQQPLPPQTWIEAEILRRKQNKISRYYPDSGPLRRELYPKHCEFFRGGATNRQRLMMAGNRVGKTEGVGAYELSCHLTGRYPSWWEGRRFDRGIKAWAAGDTSKTVREILQDKLLGPSGYYGTGMLPAETIRKTIAHRGLADAVETVYVRHVSGGTSVLVFKSYDQRREAFQGTEQDLIWLDEEPPMDIYTECLTRTMTTNGLIMLTFTPLMGLSEVVLSFLPSGDLNNPAKFTVFCTWEDVPHLDEAAKAELWASYPPHQRDARRKGIPMLGSGAIYPVPESDIVIKDFAIPDHWPRCYALDIGWNRTAALWSAHDRETDTLYLYSEHYRGDAEPVVHAESIKSRGKWIPGVIDPASRGRSQSDGHRMLDTYRGLGLDLSLADNAVEAGLYNVWMRLSAGRLRVFESLVSWRQEYRLYRRDEKGRVVKEGDHLMDCTRYAVMSGVARAKHKPVENPQPTVEYRSAESMSLSWMG